MPGIINGALGRIMNPARNIRPYTINELEEGDAVEVNLYGEVVEAVPVDYWTGEKVEGLFIELKAFLDDLDALVFYDKITFRINSVGGEVHAGQAIYQRIREMKAETTTMVDGLAASAAAIIAQAGDRRLIGRGSNIMIHGCAAMMLGFYNRHDLQVAINGVEGVDKAIAGVLAARTGNTEDRIRSMMERTTWMTAEEALEKGFADMVVDGKETKIEAANRLYYTVNGIPQYRRFFREIGGLPHGMEPVNDKWKTEDAFGEAKDLLEGEAQEVFTSAARLANIDMAEKNSKGGKNMTLDELKKEHPELVEQIRAEARAEMQDEIGAAVKAERERIRGIESIENMIGDKAMVASAKYDDPVDAKELSFKAMQAQAEAGEKFLAERAAETQASGAKTVTPDPVSGSETESREKDVIDGKNAIVNAYKSAGR